MITWYSHVMQFYIREISPSLLIHKFWIYFFCLPLASIKLLIKVLHFICPYLHIQGLWLQDLDNEYFCNKWTLDESYSPSSTLLKVENHLLNSLSESDISLMPRLFVTGLWGVAFLNVPLIIYQSKEGKKSISPVDQSITWRSCYPIKVVYVSIAPSRRNWRFFICLCTSSATSSYLVNQKINQLFLTTQVIYRGEINLCCYCLLLSFAVGLEEYFDRRCMLISTLIDLQIADTPLLSFLCGFLVKMFQKNKFLNNEKFLVEVGKSPTTNLIPSNSVLLDYVWIQWE